MALIEEERAEEMTEEDLLDLNPQLAQEEEAQDQEALEITEIDLETTILTRTEEAKDKTVREETKVFQSDLTIETDTMKEMAVATTIKKRATDMRLMSISTKSQETTI